MKFLAALTLALSASAGALAQNSTNNSGNATSFAEGLLSALRANNLTSLANAVGNNSDALLGALMGGNKTVLAPTDQAFAALGDNVDQNTLVATIAYHVLNGSVTDSMLSADKKTIIRSALNMSDYVMLPQNRSQVVVLSKHANNSTGYVQLSSGNVSFAMSSDGPQYQNILVQPIEQVLSIPPNTSAVASNLGASRLTQLLQSANLVQPLDNSIVTVFAPTNQAIMDVSQQIMSASSEQQTAVLLNHVINGTVVYSTQLADAKNAVSAAGNQLMFTTNSSGAFVSLGGISSKIIASDYAAANGVVHVIDRVLLNTTQNAAAASSAFSSNTAAAATNTGNPSGNGSGSGSGGNGANTMQISGAAAALAAVLGSGFWLLA